MPRNPKRSQYFARHTELVPTPEDSQQFPSVAKCNHKLLCLVSVQLPSGQPLLPLRVKDALTIGEIE